MLLGRGARAPPGLRRARNPEVKSHRTYENITWKYEYDDIFQSPPFEWFDRYRQTPCTTIDVTAKKKMEHQETVTVREGCREEGKVIGKWEKRSFTRTLLLLFSQKPTPPRYGVRSFEEKHRIKNDISHFWLL